ncbi:hypothetical protein ACK6TG_22530 [Escherichia coli]
MDRLYELGKRFDRLLYMSIVVVIFSFLTCSLLITLSSQNLFALITSYKDIKQQIETKRRKIEFIETQISAVNESVSDILDFRKRINKSEMDTVRYKSEIENEFFSIRKKMINEGLREIDLDEVSSINELKYFMYDVLKKEIEKSSVGYIVRDKIESALPEKDKIANYHDAMNWLDGKIKDESNSKIEIVNIESTLIIPFKIGDMASSVSLISIAKIASYAMPVFMVFWLGSLFVTRRIEMMNLMKTKDISLIYPHILNIFSVDTTKSQDFNLYLLGDEKIRKQINASIFLIKAIKGFLFISLALAMCGPLYYGEFIYLVNYNTSSLPLFIVSFSCMLINIIQAVGYVFFESISSNVIYRIKNGVIDRYELNF